MSYSIDTFTGDGSTTVFTLSFEFLSRDHVEVTRIASSGAETDLSVITSGNPGADQYVWQSDDKIKVGTAPASDQKLRVKRVTPEDAQVVEWQDGSYIIATDLNDDSLQALYLIQELTDAVDALESGTGGATGSIKEDDAKKDPENPAWSGDEKLATVGAINRVYATLVGSASGFPGTGNKGKTGKLWIDTSKTLPALLYWDQGQSKWISIQTKGDPGSKGDKGDAATLNVGTTKTTAPGSDAKVSNSGTQSAAVFDFEIPRGEKGAKGDKGDDGSSVQSDWNETDSSKSSFIKNKPSNTFDLGYTKSATGGTITNSAGNDANLPLADTTNAGLLSPTDKNKLNGLSGALVYKGTVDLTDASTIPSGLVSGDAGHSYANIKVGKAVKGWADVTSGLAENDDVGANDLVVWNGSTWNFLKNSFSAKGTDLGYTASTGGGEITSSTGSNASIPLAEGTTGGNAGLMTSSEKKKLSGIDEGAQKNTATNLSHETNDTQVIVKSSTGNNTTIDAASATGAGIMSKAQAQKLAQITADADKNVQADWNETNTNNDAYIKNKPSIGATPEDGKMTIDAGDGLQKASSDPDNFSANQAADSKMTFSVKTDGNTIQSSAAGIKVVPGNLGFTDANNGQINVEAGDGLEASGSNATANQSGDTTRTLKAKAANNTISVNSSGISVNTANLGIPNAPNNGQINVDAGDGLTASGSNATANQSGNTTRVLKVDMAYINANISGGGGGDYVSKSGDTMSGNLTVPTLNGLDFPGTTGEGGEVNKGDLKGGEVIIWGLGKQAFRVGSYISNTKECTAAGSPGDIQGSHPSGNNPGTIIARPDWVTEKGFSLVMVFAHGSVKFGQDGANFQAKISLEASPGGYIASETVTWEQRGAEWKGGAFSLQGLYRLNTSYDYKVSLSISKDRGTGTATPAAGSIRALFFK